MVAQNDDGADSGSEADATQREQTALAGQCPAIVRTAEDLRETSGEQPLNEVSALSELAAMRMLLTQQEDSKDE